jgi:hypothetical protein
MVRSFARTIYFNGNSAELARDLRGGAEGTRVAFDGEDDAFQVRSAAAGECLHGMERSGESAEACERREDGAIERAASVEDDFAAASLAGNSRERRGHSCDLRVWNSDENHLRI